MFKLLLRDAIEYAIEKYGKVSPYGLKEFYDTYGPDRRYKLYVLAMETGGRSGIVKYRHVKLFFSIDHNNEITIEHMLR